MQGRYLGIVVRHLTVLSQFLARSLTRCRRHLRQVHWVDICKYCLKQTPLHQELGCQKICASPACPHKSGKYHVSSGNCADQRHDEVTIIKYGLVCEALGLAEKCMSLTITVHGGIY